MNRWQIKSLIFYSHHGKRVEVKLEPSAVNIIVGESYCGKSALIESIDYCMGAGECHIPGLVRETCSWVGIVWLRDKTEILICRKLPPLTGKSCEDVYYAVGAPVEVPPSANELRRTTNTEGALSQFENALSMGEVVGETFGDREGKRISLRNAMPYLLQSDDVIIDKITLLRGMSDDRRQSIIDSIPYFLGAVDETTAHAEIRLKKLRSQRDREERRLSATKTKVEEAFERAGVLVQEAAQLGMVAADQDIDVEQALEILRSVANWSPEREKDVAETDRLPDLQRRERELTTTIARLNSQLTTAKDALESADGFKHAVQRQTRKLDIVNAFRVNAQRDTCPVCNASIADRTPTLTIISDALSQLRNDLEEVQQDRPQIDTYVRRLENEIGTSIRSLSLIRDQIAGIIHESETNSQRLELSQRRMWVAGRASYFIEAQSNQHDPTVSARLEELESELRDLEAQVDPEAKAERLNALQLQVAGYATDLLRKLPFDPNYRNVHVLFDARKVAIRFVRGPRVMEMRDIGGDESYLSGHICATLALHRVFAAGNRPVPGVIVYDQISRPFYAPDKTPGEVTIRAGDRTDLKEYFDLLFEEVETQKTLQVIVLEHAFFADDPRYVGAVRKRWNESEKLIPFDWPRRGESTD